jgi:hypothetical protein
MWFLGVEVMSYADYGILIRCYVDQATTKHVEPASSLAFQNACEFGRPKIGRGWEVEGQRLPSRKPQEQLLSVVKRKLISRVLFLDMTVIPYSLCVSMNEWQ